ncbi:unnamed protein product [Spirodela intermedia]|uniref:non-specific serine/threonine protein kinase n=1 Tax=Spirodela intermedia TaxID=51605 RepID=A0A7I8JJ62_SPIIN|nr:unnamed protein product [Spirodela intermedia]CAA6669911.1 unnamed protein product [Spirodela intermedia]
MIGQIKREIATMKLVRHPNVIRMYEVLASKTKIYIVLEFVTGGELFDRVSISHGRLKEDEARKYFQQLICAPENLLLDSKGVLKVTDFGLSALPQQVREDGLLHTACGTPNYVAPEVINNKGYDGAKADLWSCGVILFVLMAGYLPFDDPNLPSLYKKIFKADFSCPSWFSTSVKKLIKRMLDPILRPQHIHVLGPKEFSFLSSRLDSLQRIKIAEVVENEWFKKGYQPPAFETSDISLDDVHAVFNNSLAPINLVVERREEGPVPMNAFELIATSQGLNLGTLFEKQSAAAVKSKTRFASKHPAGEIVSRIEEVAKPLGFNVEKQNYKLRLQREKTGRKGHLSISTEVFEVAPSLYMVELRKANGDTLEFHQFYNSAAVGLKDIVWEPSGERKEEPTRNPA